MNVYIIIFLGLCFYLSQSFSSFSSTTENALQGFLSLMTQGKSYFCIENNILSDGLLISNYNIVNIDETKTQMTVNVNYTEIGLYEVDEFSLDIRHLLHKKPIQKTAQYSFQKTDKGLRITSMNPANCLLKYNIKTLN